MNGWWAIDGRLQATIKNISFLSQQDRKISMLNILDEVYSVYKLGPAVTFWKITTWNPGLLDEMISKWAIER